MLLHNLTSLRFDFDDVLFHDQNTLVQRVWFALVIRPSANMLSHTLQKTWNFSVLVRALPTQQVLMTLRICALVVIIRSAVDRRVIRTSVCFSVKVSHFRTVSKIVANRIQGVRLNNSGERSHLAFSTRVPDHSLDESLAAADGVEVDLGGAGLELHVLFP